MLVGISNSGRDGPDVTVVRAAPNVWWLCVGAPDATSDPVGSLQPGDLPSRALLEMDAAAPYADPATTTVIAKVELDVCGAWVTVANAGPARPLVVRRAGWVDVRGHPSAPLGGATSYLPADDRVGLGPGDVLVVRRDSADPDDVAAFEDVLDAALHCAGGEPS